MKIETKFDVCDPVVFIYNDEIISRTIYAIEYLFDEDDFENEFNKLYPFEEILLIL